MYVCEVDEVAVNVDHSHRTNRIASFLFVVKLDFNKEMQ